MANLLNTLPTIISRYFWSVWHLQSNFWLLSIILTIGHSSFLFRQVEPNWFLQTCHFVLENEIEAILKVGNCQKQTLNIFIKPLPEATTLYVIPEGI